MKYLLTLCLLLWANSLTFANNAPVERRISGTVIDAETKTPLEFATVSLIKNDQLIDGIITDVNGSFSMAAETGNYKIRIEYISYKNYETVITLDSDMNLGVIPLEIDMESLGEVEIVAERSTVDLKLDKKVFNVGKDLLSQGGSLLQILENVPSVGVDLDGGVSLRGNANVTVLINGKPSVLVANNGLDQIPAQQIERIEVITNPSSRYQASGTSGIINIILKKQKQAGWSGSVSISNAVRADMNANASLNYKTDKLNVFSTLGYRFVDNVITQDVTQTNSNSVLNQSANTYRNSRNFTMYVGMDYAIDTSSTITASYYKVLRKHKNLSNYHYDYFDTASALDSTIVRNEVYKEPQDHNQLELSYVKNFSKKDQSLTIDFQYDFWDDDENETFKTQNTAPIATPIELSRTRDIESSKDYLLQVDYIHPIDEDSRFETGLRGETRIITSDYKAETYDGTEWQIFNNIANELDYEETIAGLYAQYSGKLNKLTYQLGLRTEFTKIEISDKNSEFKDTKDYINWFPTTHLTYALTEKSNVQLSYSRRINRPSFWHLNPFGGLAQLNAQRQGNPDMDPALTHALELGFLTRIGKLRINPAVYYQDTKDPFQFVTERNEDDILITKPINIDSEQRIGLEVSMNYNPVKWLQLGGEFNYYSFQQRGAYNGLSFDFDDSAWFTRTNARVKLPQDWTFQSSFNYRGRNETAQTIRKANYSLDLALNKMFWNRQATVTFNVRNALNSREEFITRTGDSFVLNSHRQLLGPKYILSFTYRFNQSGNNRTRRPGQSNR